MGKVTLWHPVSLQVLRGAMVYGGWTVGKFSQVGFSIQKQTATYTVNLVSWDRPLGNCDVVTIKTALNACFASDVEITSVWITSLGTYMAKIVTYTAQTSFLDKVEV